MAEGCPWTLSDSFQTELCGRHAHHQRMEQHVKLRGGPNTDSVRIRTARKRLITLEWQPGFLDDCY